MPFPPRPFRFTIQCSSPAAVDLSSWRTLARRCEELGYDALTVSDHLDEQVAPSPALMAAADATTRLRVGSMVYCNDYRHPVALAKEAATIDVLSAGRFDFGIGAGWLANDYERAGITLDPPLERIARLGEALEVIKGLFSGDPIDFDGRYYHVHGLAGTPRPLQSPGPPILIGGGGRRMLELAARHADVVGLNPSMRKGVIDASLGADATEAATKKKLDWIAASAGERFSKIELQVRVHLVVVTNERAKVAGELAALFGVEEADALRSPHALFGTAEQIAEDLLERRELFGISAIGVPNEALEPLAPVVEALSGR